MPSLPLRLSGAAAACAAAIALSACGSSTPTPTGPAANDRTGPSAVATYTAPPVPGVSTTAGATSSTSTAPTPAASAGTAVSGATDVAIRNYMFMPMKLTVTAGTKVTFHNYDQTAHTATADNQTTFDSGTIAPGASKTITMTKPGTYAYKCLFHAFMQATITVVPKA